MMRFAIASDSGFKAHSRNERSSSGYQNLGEYQELRIEAKWMKAGTQHISTPGMDD